MFPNALRHLFASMALSHGVDIRTLADRLGHSDPTFTLRRYVHRAECRRQTARCLAQGLRAHGLTWCATSVQDDLEDGTKTQARKLDVHYFDV